MNALTTNQTTLQYDFSVLDRADLQPSSRVKYKRAILAYVATGAALTDRRALADYAQTISASGRAFLKAALALWVDELSKDLKGQATPENVQAIQAALMRLEVLTDTVKVSTPKGEKAHFWLSPSQVKKLMNVCCPDTLTGRRDWIILAVLVDAGLRREELTALTFDDIKILPIKGKFRTVLEIKHGKGDKARVIPISDKLADKLAAWKQETGGGKVARSLGRAGVLGASISAVGVFDVVRKHGAAIGIPALAAHDLRRSYAQIGYEGGVSITQISTLLGHSSVETTQKYLNLSLDLAVSVCDFIPL